MAGYRCECVWVYREFMSNSLIYNLAPLNFIKLSVWERLLVCSSSVLFVCGFGGGNHLMHIIHFIACKIHNSPKFPKENSRNDSALRLSTINLNSVRVNLLPEMTYSLAHTLAVLPCLMRNWFDAIYNWLKMHVEISKRREWTSRKKLHLLTCEYTFVDGTHAHTLNKLIENRFLLSMNSAYTHKLDNERKKVELGLCIDSRCTLFVHWLQMRDARTFIAYSKDKHTWTQSESERESTNAEESAFQLCTIIHFQYQCISPAFIH